MHSTLAGWIAGPILRSVIIASLGFASWSLVVGTVKLTGMTSNGQPFDANPLRIWFVTDSHAVVRGEELGTIRPLAEQAHLRDFYIPQRGVFAVGRVFVTRTADEGPTANRLRRY
jgi:hypothetical protein